jgi:hypothetical protein
MSFTPPSATSVKHPLPGWAEFAYNRRMAGGDKLLHLVSTLTVFALSQMPREQAAALLPGALVGLFGDKMYDALRERLENLQAAGKTKHAITAAFESADQCFRRQTRNDSDANLHQAIVSAPLARLETLESLAAALPKTLDDVALRAALRSAFASGLPNALNAAEQDRAATLYLDCLRAPLAAQCGQWLPQIFQIVQENLAVSRETLARVQEIQQRLGAPLTWRAP